MRVLRNNPATDTPRLSIVLLDWSVRESLHSLDYLANQDVDRSDYELLWIEYFDRESDDLRSRLDTAAANRQPPSVDTWIVMDVPRDVCHHKHLMYNVGLLAARGELVCFCDSDAMFRTGFVRSIFETFDDDPNVVLHHDQVRNHLPRYYPFRFPTFEEVTGFGCYQWVHGKPLGLRDEDDPLHTRNYGASLTARRDDLFAIGGADMHTDYLGHVCGPYEMTFRLSNHGRREVWHPDEFLYHTWHPGQAGTVDYCGPHDGLHMSTTALEARETGRVKPLVEHPAIAAVRSGEVAAQNLESRLSMAVRDEWLRDWHRDQIVNLPSPDRDTQAVPHPPFGKRMTRWQRLRLMPLVARIVCDRYFRGASAANGVEPDGPASNRFRSACLYARYLVRICWLHLAWLKSRNVTAIQIVGDDVAMKLAQSIARSLDLAVISNPEPVGEDLPVVIAALADAGPFRKLMQTMGVSSERIIAIPQ